MRPIVDLQDCLIDSPKFRASLQANENNIQLLESKLEKVIRLCNDMIEASKTFIKSKGLFINSVFELSAYFEEDPYVSDTLDEMNKILKKLQTYQSMLVDQMSRTVSRNLTNFLKTDIYKTKEIKRHFDKISEDYDCVLNKNSACLKTKPSECEEVFNILKATRSCFQHTGLDYVCQISCLQSKKRHEILDSLLLLIQAYGTYFHQGSDLLKDFDAKRVADSIQEMREETQSLQRQLEHNHSFVKLDSETPSFMCDGDYKGSQGYLFKRTTNAFRTWNRRWFIIQDNRLIYQKKTEKDVTVMEEDLRLCNVKPVNDGERRFCFEIVSPSRYHMLQADSEEGCKHWIASLQAGIDAAYNDTSQDSNEASDSFESCNTSISSNSPKSASQNTSINNLCPPRSHKVLPIITGLAGNEYCADCKSSDSKWASINLGITLCIECSGVHRSLGVHVSKVKSLILDAWDGEQIKLMLELGNNLLNSILEENVDERGVNRLNHSSSAAEREIFIKAKYIEKRFMKRKHANLSNGPESIKISSDKKSSSENNHTKELSSNLPDCQNHLNLLLYSAAKNANLNSMCKAVLRGANVDWSNTDDDNQTPLHKSVENDTLPCCEYLILNGAKVNFQDNHGRSPLHLAVDRGNTGIVCLLLKRGADLSCLDNSGSDPLAIAVNNTNADIVTLLRIAKLNEEMKNDEYNNCHEDLLNEVVRDFSNKASARDDSIKSESKSD